MGDDADYDKHKDDTDPGGTHRVETSDLWAILPFAWILDLLSIIPGANMLVVFFGQLVMSLIWIMHGVTPWGKRNWIWYLVTWVAEFIPLVSILPMFTFESMRFFTISRIEDKVKRIAAMKKLDNEKAKAVTARFLKQKKVQEKIQSLQEKAVTRKDGTVDRDRQNRINDRRQQLDEALKPDPNSGIRGAAGLALANKQPAFRQNRADDTPEPANDTVPQQEDVAA